MDRTLVPARTRSDRTPRPLGRLWALLSCALAFALGAGIGAGCGGDTDTPSSKRGYVECGVLTCNPGQHCNNLSCQAGCQSNDNCASDQTCTNIDEFFHVGTCQNNAPAPDMSTTASSLERCKQACLSLVTCNLVSVNDGAGCQNDCSGITDIQRGTFSACVEAWNCKSEGIPGCLAPYQCGGDFKCSGGKQCVGHRCL